MTDETPARRGIVWHVPSVRDEEAEAFRDLLPKAQKGDREALQEIRGRLTRAEWQAVGDVGRQVVANLTERTTGHDPALSKAIQAHAEGLREELTPEAPSALERLIVERVIACYLAVCEADLAAHAATGAEHTLALGLYHARRQDLANKRFLAACKTLATVRKLLRPGAVQVNIAAGDQQNILQALMAGRIPSPIPASQGQSGASEADSHR